MKQLRRLDVLVRDEAPAGHLSPLERPVERPANGFTRRRFLQGVAAMGVLAGLESLAPAYAFPKAVAGRSGDTEAAGDVIELEIARKPVVIGGREVHPITLNGSIPGPIVRLKEGKTAIIRVTNRLDEDTSIHWHGILVPFRMDGVPGVSFRGIGPGETFTYRYPVKQSGTYWYHSHSGMQEQLGHYGPLIIDSAGSEPFEYDRDHVVMLSDWTFEDPHQVMAHLKQEAGYYNFHQRTVGDFFRDVAEKGWRETWKERAMWARMRMSSRDLLDVSGYTYAYLVNGLAPPSNWTGLFHPGERVRLRFINGSAMTLFDVRIPGLKMTVVAADGQPVEPVPVDEFRIGVAEVYDVIVEPQEDRAYTIFAEAMDRSGYARGTLAPRDGMSAPIPALRPVPERTMADMGMGMHGGHGAMAGMTQAGASQDGRGATAGSAPGTHPGMDHGAMGHAMHGMGTETGTGGGGSEAGMSHEGMSHAGMSHEGTAHAGMSHDVAGMDHASGVETFVHGPDHHGPGTDMVAMQAKNRLGEPGTGLEEAKHKVLVYTDLRSPEPYPDQRAPGRELEIHLTGNMERFMWSFDGKKYSEAREPIRFKHGERLRLTMVNDTMMEHPIHLHGMWMYLENGTGAHKPRKHTITVKPGERLAVEITADAPGDWAFHCHLLYHMEAGMFRVVSVTEA